jgi:hypothetical protein
MGKMGKPSLVPVPLVMNVPAAEVPKWLGKFPLGPQVGPQITHLQATLNPLICNVPLHTAHSTPHDTVVQIVSK